MPAGRPLETVADLPEGWYNRVLDLYKVGASDVEIKAWLYELRGRFSNDLWDRWLKEEEQFSETIKMGRVLSERWWCEQGRTSLKNKDFNYTGWYMNMKNRFGWKDKTETDITTQGEKINTTQVFQFIVDDKTDTSAQQADASDAVPDKP